MLTLLAIFIIILGLYLIISGLREDIGEVREVRVKPLEEYEREYDREELEYRAGKKRKVRGGGVILIGPIPIVFGDSKYAILSLILAIILMLISIYLILFMRYA